MKGTKIRTVILLVLACLVLLVTGTYAAYTNVESAKRVIVAGGNAKEMRFSSNILSESSDNEFPYRPINVGTSNEASFGLTICNYPQNNITKVSEDTITYNLVFELVDENKDQVKDKDLLSKLSILDTSSGVEDVIPLTGTLQYTGKVLTGNTASRHLYTIACNDVPGIKEYSLRIRAEATDPKLSSSLAADIKFTTSATLESNWTGSIVEQEEELDLESLDAINYRIHGTAAGELKLSWDDTVSISPWFVDELKLSDDEIQLEPNSITFPVGQPNQPTSYHIQFYWKNGTPTSWPKINVTFPVS